MQAQQAFPSSGGEAAGPGGTVSYSTGQIVYTTMSSSGDTVSEGVQQPYEISVLGTDKFTSISLSAIVYPNPTVSSVSLKIEFADMPGLRYKLFDFNGRLIAAGDITNTTTIIAMENLSDATYILNVYTEMYRLKSFKILKRNR